MRHLVRSLPILFIAALLVAGCTDTDLSGAKVVLSDDYTVASGEVVDTDIVVMSGDVEIEEGGVVEGDVVAFSGDIRVDGEVLGDVFTFSGDIELGATATVDGDANTLSGTIREESGAAVAGTAGEGELTLPDMDFEAPTANPLQALLWLLVRSLLPAVVAAVVAGIWPKNVLRAVWTATEEPIAAGTVGILALVVALPVIGILLLTVCLCWLGGILAAVVFLGLLFGWAALGTEVGQRLGRHLGSEWPLAGAAFVGTWILSIVLALIELVPCFGLLLSLLVSAIALGTALLTHFGRRAYPEMTSETETA